MPESSQKKLNGEETFPLKAVPGTGVQPPEDSQVICISEDCPASCCRDTYHRKLAIAGIVCGFSCCGVPALVYSVKAEDADKAEKAEQTTDRKSAKYLRLAKKWGIIAVTTWVCMLATAPMLLTLISYLFTLID